VRPKVLLVDDDADTLRTLRSVLGGVCTVIEASNGPDALRLLERERPRLMLLDIAMPAMGGLEILRAAARLSPATIVMMLTGDRDLDLAVVALQLGARAYVTKPFDTEYLRGEVRRLLEPSMRAKSGDPPWRVLKD
jgi:DNA-binding NtrC family response regulator